MNGENNNQNNNQNNNYNLNTSIGNDAFNAFNQNAANFQKHLEEEKKVQEDKTAVVNTSLPNQPVTQDNKVENNSKKKKMDLNQLDAMIQKNEEKKKDETDSSKKKKDIIILIVLILVLILVCIWSFKVFSSMM